MQELLIVTHAPLPQAITPPPWQQAQLQLTLELLIVTLPQVTLIAPPQEQAQLLVMPEPEMVTLPQETLTAPPQEPAVLQSKTELEMVTVALPVTRTAPPDIPE